MIYEILCDTGARYSNFNVFLIEFSNGLTDDLSVFKEYIELSGSDQDCSMLSTEIAHYYQRHDYEHELGHFIEAIYDIIYKMSFKYNLRLEMDISDSMLIAMNQKSFPVLIDLLINIKKYLIKNTVR